METKEIRNRVTEFFNSISRLSGIDMQPQKVRNRIAGYFNSNRATFTPEELESFYTRVISDLPRTGDNTEALNWAYEVFIAMLLKQDRSAQAALVFKQYLGDCAPACDPAYDQIYQAGLLATGSRSVPLRRRDRFFSLVQLFRKTLPLEGLVAECGCFRGLSSYLLCSFLKLADSQFSGRGYRIFDSFAGLSAPQPEDEITEAGANAERIRLVSHQGAFAAPLSVVKNSLSTFPGIEYFPGWIPAAFPDKSDDRYRFVHVDVDIYQPTHDSIEYFYPRLVPGGILVSDDYSWPGARKAIEEFCTRNGVELNTTPHTQAYIVRRE